MFGELSRYDLLWMVMENLNIYTSTGKALLFK